uniref:Uncharacterized protein n=1 Tax=Ascaris lumbricoides TaxID=6252 RepID=A0A0M3HIA0_ASCLU
MMFQALWLRCFRVRMRFVSSCRRIELVINMGLWEHGCS